MKMRAYTFIIYLLVLIQIPSFGQELSIEWQNNIGGTNDDHPNKILQLSDGNYICGGATWSTPSGDKSSELNGIQDFWIVKLTPDGSMIWERSYGGGNRDKMLSFIETSDGGIIIVGNSNSGISGDKSEENIGFNDLWIVKIDSDGNIEWENTIGGTDRDTAIDIIEVNGGDYVIAGNSYSNISEDKSEDSFGGMDYWIIKITSSGEILWDRTFGGEAHDALAEVAYVESDAGLILVGTSFSNPSGFKSDPVIGDGTWGDVWIVRLDFYGEFMWDRTIGGTKEDIAHSVMQATDGNFIITAASNSPISGDKSEESRGMFDYWIVKIDPSGEIIWEKTMGGNGTEAPQAVLETADGHTIISGNSTSDVSFDRTDYLRGVQDIWIVEMDASGNILWDRAYGGTERDYLTDFKATEDGGFIAASGSYSNESEDKTEDLIEGSFPETRDFWILKLKECDEIVPTITQDGSTLISSPGISYQWVDCDNDFEPIPGETEQNFTISENGNYAVIVSYDDCEEMSDCFPISTIGLVESDLKSIILHPNPTNDLVYTTINSNIEHYILTDLTGKVLLKSNEDIIDLSHFENGIYMLSIYDNNQSLIQASRIVKQ